MTKPVILKALKVDQPIGDFYIGAVDSNQLLKIATVDVRKFLDDNAESLEGIQRKLVPSRKKKISEYVEFEYATFPTSIVIAIDERCITVTESKDCFGLFDIEIHGFEGDDFSPPINIEESAFIIDGQHRLAGLEQYSQKKPFELNVSIFVGLDKADQAEIFSTVNLTQTKVNKSLVYDLYNYQKKPSPTKLAHEVTIALDQHKNGPFHEKIKRLGVSTPGRDRGTERLSQATVVRGMLRHLPARVDVERNKGFLGLNRTPEANENWRRRVFTPFYRKEDDVSVFQLMTNYFSAVEERWSSAWNDEDEEYMLCSTNGYNALIRFFHDAYLASTDKPRVVTKEEFTKIFANIEIPKSKLVTTEYLPGSSGASKLYKDLLHLSGL